MAKKPLCYKFSFIIGKGCVSVLTGDQEENEKYITIIKTEATTICSERQAGRQLMMMKCVIGLPTHQHATEQENATGHANPNQTNPKLMQCGLEFNIAYIPNNGIGDGAPSVRTFYYDKQCALNRYDSAVFAPIVALQLSTFFCEGNKCTILYLLPHQQRAHETTFVPKGALSTKRGLNLLKCSANYDCAGAYFLILTSNRI